MAFKTAVLLDEVYLNHRAPAGHPECSDRIRVLLEDEALRNLRGVLPLGAGRLATLEELAMNHSPGHIARIAGTQGKPGTQLDMDTFVSAGSYESALFAAGGVLDLVDRVMAGKLDNGMALVRPPGHHAEKDRAMGFCLFNNVAVGARYLLERHGLTRVLIVDWDVHHGNGTQNSFYDDRRVLYVSLHQYPFYPGTGALDEVGGGGAQGYTVNVPLSPGCGDDEYMLAFTDVVEPIANQFRPEFVLVSAGFDAHRADPLGGMAVTERGFAAMTSVLLKVASAHARNRCLAVLEGGYSLDGLARSVRAVVEALRGGFEEPAGKGTLSAEWLRPVRDVHGVFWSL